MIKLILFVLFFYIIFKIVRGFVTLVGKPKEPKAPFVNKDEQGSVSGNIKSEDIIDADFEEIKTSESETSKDN